MGIAEEMADKLAADVIAHLERTGDEDIVSIISKSLGDSSQTLQEAFVTSVRVQRAALRAERLLRARSEELSAPSAPKADAAEPQPERAPEPEPAAPEVAQAPEPAPQAEPDPAPAPEPEPAASPEPSRAALRARRLLEEREAARKAELEGAARRGRRAVPQVKGDPSLG